MGTAGSGAVGVGPERARMPERSSCVRAPWVSAFAARPASRNSLHTAANPDATDRVEVVQGRVTEFSGGPRYALGHEEGGRIRAVQSGRQGVRLQHHVGA